MNGRWPDPFIIQIFPFQFTKNIANQNINKLMEPKIALLEKEIIQRKSYLDILEAQKTVKQEQESKQRKEFQERTLEKKIADDNQLIQILTNIKDHPFIDQKSRIEMLGLKGSASTVNNLFKELVERGFVTAHKIGLGKGKGVRIIYEMTEKGMEFARIKPFTIPGRSGFVHKFWQHKIKKYYEKKGFEAEIEKRVGLKNVDVGVTIGDDLVALEVELSPDHLIQNIEKDLVSGCSLIIVCCPNQKRMSNYRKRVAEHDEPLLDSIEFKILPEFHEG